MVWFLAALGALAWFAVFAAVRRLRKKLDALNHSYWELRYEYTRLRADLARLDPEQAANPIEPEAAPVAFVPLSSVKRSRDE